MTVDQGLARLMEAEKIIDEAERRKVYRSILNDVRSGGYQKGGDDAVDQGWW